jgi:SAM-dependent methyltransferase
MESFWDQRFSEEGFAYGEQPNAFFRDQLSLLEPGSVLLPGEGEGRNAVWAATRGWSVHALDTSTVARDKALAMAASRGVEISYELRSVTDALDAHQRAFDAVGLVFLHVPSEIRRSMHRAAVNCLRPGGTVILEGFSTEQIHRTTGGPRDVDLLFTVDDLRRDFDQLRLLHLDRSEVELDEGRYHQGVASVVRLVAQR